MSLSILYSRALHGMGAPRVTVETYVAGACPRFISLGWPTPKCERAASVYGPLSNA